MTEREAGHAALLNARPQLLQMKAVSARLSERRATIRTPAPIQKFGYLPVHAMSHPADIGIWSGSSSNEERIHPNRPSVPLSPIVQLQGDAAAASNAQGASQAVPGLSQQIVDEVGKAGNTQQERNKLLADLYAEIKSKYVSSDIADHITIVYSANLSSALGEYKASEIPHDNNVGGTIEIASEAFASAAVLYSTIRHELIHAEQFRPHQVERQRLYAQYKQNQQNKTDDQIKDGFDRANAKVDIQTNKAFIYEDRHKPANTPKCLKEFLEYASEVETHAWEVLNASHTGIDKGVADPKFNQQTFLQGRKDWLQYYAAQAEGKYQTLISTQYYKNLEDTEKKTYETYMIRVLSLAKGGGF